MIDNNNPNLLTLLHYRNLSFTMTGYHGIESRVDADEVWSESFMLGPEKKPKRSDGTFM